MLWQQREGSAVLKGTAWSAKSLSLLKGTAPNTTNLTASALGGTGVKYSVLYNSERQEE